MERDKPFRSAMARSRHVRGRFWRNRTRIVRIRTSDAQTAADSRLQCNPDWSAAHVRFRFRYLLPVLLLFLMGLHAWPGIVLAGARLALFSIFAAGIIFRTLLLVFVPARSSHQVEANPPDTRILPVVTILLPLHDEAKVLPQLVTSIAALDWPTDRLDVKLLLEADDETTITCARQMRLPVHWEVLVLPRIGPQTKPKALNVGLARARGSFVTIFDAEDIPHPGQLRTAMQKFAEGGKNLVCVQAPLSVHNARDGWLSAQFAAEYDAHFRVLLPAMHRLGIIFPLGGTSNYFRTRALREIGSWDAHNVTEDADLGFRLARMGGRLACINLPTQEEATRTLHAWTGQRSRWIKGFMQTLIVHLRNVHELGFRQGIGLLLFLGLSLLSSFLHLPTLIYCLACIGWALAGHAALPIPDLLLASTGLLSALWLLVLGMQRAGKAVSLWRLASAPLYWPLQTMAAVRAFTEMFTRPFHWQKTDHGHTLHAPEDES